MAESEDGQEKSEEPTARKLEKAREEGNIARSKELSGLLLMLGGGVAFLLVADGIAEAIGGVFQTSFTVDRQALMDPKTLPLIFMVSVKEVGLSLLPLFAFLAVAAIVGNVALGGFNLSLKALAPKASRMNPLSGLKKMFSVRSLMELIKTLGKFILVAVTAIYVLYLQMPDLMGLGQEPLLQSIAHAISLLVWGFIWVCLSLAVITIIDIPFQIWNHQQQLKMTKQEIKDEFKDTEGKPEVKGRIRQLQRDMAQSRMMSSVPEADVVITNPTHYSVALKYDASSAPAPILLAKGGDQIAFKIREVAEANNVTMVTAPPLARAVYFTTEINQEIPTELYLAVAQVLAYVYRLNEFQKGRGPRPEPVPDFPIPDSHRFD